jgi:hypothetical protein
LGSKQHASRVRFCSLKVSRNLLKKPNTAFDPKGTLITYFDTVFDSAIVGDRELFRFFRWNLHLHLSIVAQELVHLLPNQCLVILSETLTCA